MEKSFQGYVFCHFAIMEIEAWLLGMGWMFYKIDNSLTQENLKINLDFDLDSNPEACEFHPATQLKKIFNYVGMDYGKHANDVNSMMSYLDKGDFELLLALDKCESFNLFITNLLE